MKFKIKKSSQLLAFSRQITRTESWRLIAAPKGSLWEKLKYTPMNIKNPPIVKAQMLIRKPIEEVFEAMVNPEITSKFWFTKSTGPVEPGVTLEWEWGQFGVSDTVDILEVKANEYISLEWKLGELKTLVEMEFESHSDTSTLFKVTESGFWENDPTEDEKLEEKINLMLGQNGGWILVLSNMKGWLEHKIDLNLIADHNP